MAMKSWFENVRLNPDVESGRLAMATYAIDFGGVLANSTGVPLVYRESRAFWQATFLTGGVRRLLEEVLARLGGPGGDRVLQLRSPFGGGKSHILAALYHAVNNRSAFEEGVPDAKKFPNPGKVRVVGIDAEKFGPQSGMEFAGRKVHTLWGALGAQLDCYDLIQKEEELRVAPGGSTIKQMLGETPTLVLFDETLRYVEKAMAISVGESNLGRQTLDFIQTLTTETANSEHAVFLYSLQASTREALGNAGLLSQLDHVTSREDAKREPVVGDEILDVLKKRLLDAEPSKVVTQEVAAGVAQAVSQWLSSEAPDEQSRRTARDQQIRLARRLEAAYPFHSGLIDIMKTRWASLPDFQRTRGALRFLACVMHKAKKLGRQSILIGPGDIPLEDADVRNAFFTEVGQREPFQAVLEHDFTGHDAKTKAIDVQLAQQNPALANARPATRLATAILMYSFVGSGEGAGEALPPGVSERELLEVCLTPELDSITARSVLKQLRERCLYLHFDGVYYSFKTEANVNLLVENEADGVTQDEAKDRIKFELEQRIGEATNAAIVWPESSAKIPDRQPMFILAYLAPEHAESTKEEQDRRVLDLLTTYGEQLRRFRNGVAVATPDRKPLQGLRRAARYLLAVERVRQKKTIHHLTKEQMDQLKERQTTEESALESSFRGLYPSVTLLKMEDSQLTLDVLDIGGRSIREQNLHQRLIEFLGKGCMGRVFGDLKVPRVLAQAHLGTGVGERSTADTKELRDSFFETLGLPCLTTEEVLAQAIADGVRDKAFVYAMKSKVKREGEKCSVREEDLPRGTIPAEEIDLDGGVILLPECVIPREAAPPPPLEPGHTHGPDEVKEPTKGPQPPPDPRAAVKKVELDLHLTKKTLFGTYKVLDSLSDKAGVLHLTVVAESLQGIPRDWLRNAVEEPLDEMNLEPPAKVEKK